MKEKFLPIGTVVILNGGTKPLMITGYCISKKNEINNEKPEMFDYGACTYPEGVISSELIYAFNHSQIYEILFEGYITKDSSELSKVLNGGYEIYKKKLAESSKQIGGQ